MKTEPNNMYRKLTDKDKKELRYQTRMGYIIPSMIFMIGSSIFIAVFKLDLNTRFSLNDNILFLVIVVFALFAFMIGYKMNHKYIADIRNDEKRIETKIIQKKESKISYEAGSGTLYIGQDMKGSDLFSIVVENYRYTVEKEIFENCREGDAVYFNYGPVSGYLINIELIHSGKPGIN